MHQRAVRGLVAAAATPFTEQLLPDAGQLARHCRRLLERGCDAVLVLGSTGEANSLSVEERLALLEHLDQAGLGPSLLVGVKNSGGEWSYTARLLRELPRLSVFTGTEEHLLASLRLGGSGCISATFNVIAREAAPVYRGFGVLPDMQRIHHLQDRLTLLRRTFAGCSMIPAIKIVLGRLYPDEGWNRLRPPLTTLGDQEGAALLEGLRGAGVQGV